MYHPEKAHKLSRMLCTLVEKSTMIKLASDINLIYCQEGCVFDVLSSNGYTEKDLLLFHDAMNEVTITYSWEDDE
jgi:hypothetical protein